MLEIRGSTRASQMRDMYKLSAAPNEAEHVDLAFDAGNCVAVNGMSLSPLGVMQTLNKLGGKLVLVGWTSSKIALSE